MIIAVVVSLILFFKKSKEIDCKAIEDELIFKYWLFPTVIVIITTGYFLDPVVNFAAVNSHAPKGVIGFFALAMLTSWPELKSSIILIYFEEIIKILHKTRYIKYNNKLFLKEKIKKFKGIIVLYIIFLLSISINYLCFLVFHSLSH